MTGHRATVMDAYDALPYESLPVPETHPGHLAVLGRLYGLDAPDPRSARVLELGCASGGNLIPLAFYGPDGRYLGVDLSQRQVEAGCRRIEALGLDNIELQVGDIARLNEVLTGEFDYIIAHGVYSWIPAPARDALLALCHDRLSPNGIAYISYNTLPGWRMRGMLRDIQRYCARDAETDAARVAAARVGLARLQAALGDLDALNARYLRAEIPALLDNPDSYIRHEYLAEHNAAFLFSDFFAAAQRHRLGYLCDAELHTEFPQLLGEATEQALADIDDAIELGQWLDFVRARNMRRSLLVRDDARLGEGIDFDCVERFSYCGDLQPPPKLDLRREKGAPFKRVDNERFVVRHPLTKAALLELGKRYPAVVALPDLLRAARERLIAAGAAAHAQQIDAFIAEWFTLFVQGAVRARVAPMSCPRSSGEAPLPNRLARAQIAAGEYRVTSVHHESVMLDEAAAALLAGLDGTRPLAQLAAHEQHLIGELMRYGLVE